TGIMKFVVPKFKEIFADFGQKLPGPTQLLLDASDFIVGTTKDAKGNTVDMLIPGWALIIFSPVVFYAIIKLINHFEATRFGRDVVLMKIPVLGQIVSKTTVARFSRTLGTLISAGVPILEAINITRETSGNLVFARALGHVHDSIREGDSF